MEIEEYLKGRDYLENREKKLFELIDKMDKESFKLFSEIVDLDMNSFYKVDNLFIRVNNLSDMLDQLSDCYDYLKEIEMNSFSFAGRRLLLKRLMTATVSAFAIIANIGLGLISFITLSSLANKYYAIEIGDLTERIDQYNKCDLSKIASVLLNCANLLKGKMNKLYKKEEDELLDEELVIANNSIACYLAEDITEEDIDALSDDSKFAIVKLLQKDLKSESDNIYELLNRLKSQSDAAIKLSKELN
jgi:hypothetical protein